MSRDSTTSAMASESGEAEHRDRARRWNDRDAVPGLMGDAAGIIPLEASAEVDVVIWTCAPVSIAQ